MPVFTWRRLGGCSAPARWCEYGRPYMGRVDLLFKSLDAPPIVAGVSLSCEHALARDCDHLASLESGTLDGSTDGEKG